MKYEAVVVSNREQLIDELNNQKRVIIVDNTEGLYDNLKETAKDNKTNRRLGKASGAAAVIFAIELVCGVLAPPIGLAEAAILGGATVGTAVASKKLKNKTIKDYNLLELDEENKRMVLAYKKYNKKKDKYYSKDDYILALFKEPLYYYDYDNPNIKDDFEYESTDVSWMKSSTKRKRFAEDITERVKYYAGNAGITLSPESIEEFEKNIKAIIDRNFDINTAKNFEVFAYTINRVLSEGDSTVKNEGTAEGNIHIDYIRESFEKINKWTAEITAYIDGLE